MSILGVQAISIKGGERMQSLREQLQQFVARVTRTKVTFEVSPGRRVTVYRTIFARGQTDPDALYEALIRERVPLKEALEVIAELEREPNLPVLLRQYDPSGSPKRRATDEVAIASAPAA